MRRLLGSGERQNSNRRLFAAQSSPAGGTPSFRTFKSDTARHAEYLELKAGDVLRFSNLLRKRNGSTKIFYVFFHLADNRRSRCIWQSRHIALMIELLDRKRGS